MTNRITVIANRSTAR